MGAAAEASYWTSQFCQCLYPSPAMNISIWNGQTFVYTVDIRRKRLKNLFNLLFLQLKSNPSENEEKEAQSQLTKSDEMQRLRSQALDAFESSDYTAAITFLDKILEVSV